MMENDFDIIWRLFFDIMLDNGDFNGVAGVVYLVLIGVLICFIYERF